MSREKNSRRRQLSLDMKRSIAGFAEQNNVRRSAISIAAVELVSLLEGLPEIKIRHEAIPERTRSDAYAPEASVYDVTGDWFTRLNPIQSDALPA